MVHFTVFGFVLVLCVSAVESFHALRSVGARFRSKASTALSMSSVGREDLRNVCVIAHVDHGKTTLVDSMLKQSGAFRTNEQAVSMDSDQQEKERGITILAKNCAVLYDGRKINLVDTPGHADFGGEVERIMNMVDGVLLVVDSVDGPKPQTRFVLKKALEKGLRAIVVVNKIDKPAARPEYVVDKTFDLFAELNASDEQMDFQIVYASGIAGTASTDPGTASEGDLTPLFDEILKLPKAEVNEDLPLQILIANVDYDEFKGKMGIGRVLNGKIKPSDTIKYGKPGEVYKTGKVNDVFMFDNIGRTDVDLATGGDIVMITGIPDITIGDTIMDMADPRPMVPIEVEEPTVRMSISVNKSPLAGLEGKLVQSRAIRDRLYKELDRNVALQVSETDSADTYEVCGRGQLHLTVLIENMRREGFELMVGPPTVIEKLIDGVRCEPFEIVEITVPNDYSGAVVDILNKRKGMMRAMAPSEGSEGQTQVTFSVPTRAMIGVRSQLLSATRGEAVMDTQFDDYKQYAGPISQREKGSLLAFEGGKANSNGIAGAQDRGKMFITPKSEVYKDMIVGIHQRPGDLSVNVCKTKALTNMRASGSDDMVQVVPAMELNLDIAVEYIQADELVEVTPTKVRMLKHPNHRDMAKRNKTAAGPKKK
jgi:GTP-binding protein